MSRVDERKAAMRAIQIARLDGPQAAEIVEIDEPSGDGEVLIDVHAAGVAFPDALQIARALPAQAGDALHAGGGGRRGGAQRPGRSTRDGG